MDGHCIDESFLHFTNTLTVLFGKNIFGHFSMHSRMEYIVVFTMTLMTMRIMLAEVFEKSDNYCCLVLNAIVTTFLHKSDSQCFDFGRSWK